MSEDKLSEEEIVGLVLFSLGWLFLGYWLITQFFTFADSWIPVLFLLLPYLVIVSKVWRVTIKAGTTGVEVTSAPPISNKVSKVETTKTIVDKIERTLPSKDFPQRDAMLELLTKNEFEGLSQEQWNRIKGIAKHIAVYTYSPILKVGAISEATGYEYFPVIDNDESRELKGVVTRSQLLDYRMKHADPEIGSIENILAEKKPPMRAYINESTKTVLKRMLSSNLTRIPVVDARNRLEGVVALKDISDVVK